MSHKKSKDISVIEKCENIIKSFNPITHSIDTHIADILGDVTSANAIPENVLIQQIVYGCYKEKPLLKRFIDVFYGDNASRVLRVDMTMYTILTYLTVFRLEELEMSKFKSIALTQEPSKISIFISYLFNIENLWNTIRASWMKVIDLEYIENKLIPKLERFIPDMMKFTHELEANAASEAAAQLVKEEAKAKGEAGLTKVSKKASTRPQSPKLTQTKLPIIPEPERIPSQLHAKEVPGFIYKTNLIMIENEKKLIKDKIYDDTKSKYHSKLLYKFHETKSGRTIDEIKTEIENERNKELAFDSSFYKEPPNFNKSNPEIKLNTSSILKEDYLYRKQQAKDVAILKQYEEELRDPFEYYLWQHELKEKDYSDKIKQVVFRREQAKQTAIEAKDAMFKQKQDNYTVANLMREQAEVIKDQMELEKEIEILKNKQVVQKIALDRDKNPIEATQKVLKTHIEVGKQVREELEVKRIQKEIEDQKKEEIKADKIRQLRALNTIHKEHVVVFDPTLTAGVTLLDQMSYMEMKLRQKQEKQKQKELEEIKRIEILEEKEHKLNDLERRKLVIMNARDIKTKAGHEARIKLKEKKKREEDESIKARKESDIYMKHEIAKRQEIKKEEQEVLKAEEARIKRQQQYLGIAMGQVEELREKELELAKERQLKTFEKETKLQEELKSQSLASDRKNKILISKQINKNKLINIIEKDLLYHKEEKIAIEKKKLNVIEKKKMFQIGQKQHDRTKTITIDYNPYAYDISQESLTKLHSMQRYPRSNSSSGSSNYNQANHNNSSIKQVQIIS